MCSYIDIHMYIYLLKAVCVCVYLHVPPEASDQQQLLSFIISTEVSGTFEDMSYSRCYCRMMDSLLIYLAVSLLRRPEIMRLHYREVDGRYFESVTESRLPLCDSPGPSAA